MPDRDSQCHATHPCRRCARHDDCWREEGIRATGAFWQHICRYHKEEPQDGWSYDNGHCFTAMKREAKRT
jgi:hypothetical protein